MTASDGSSPQQLSSLRRADEKLMRASLRSRLFGRKPEPLMVGRFELREVIGRGGMGVVYAAWDTVLAREVAIKVISNHVDSREIRARFRREVLLTARLQHPSIVGAIDVGETAEGEPYCVMQRVHGESLATAVRARATLAERLALLPNVVDAMHAVAYAHDVKVLHRDLKPGNILLGRFGETLLLDWGLAIAMDARFEAGAPNAAPSAAASGASSGAMGAAASLFSGAIAGTPGYMAPEQVLGEPLGVYSDIYALGAVLYFVLAGRAPYASATADEVMDEIRRGPPRPLASLTPDVPPPLLSIVERAMARDPERRFGSAFALATELKTYMAGQLVGSHAYGARELVVRWVRQHKQAVAVGVASLVALAVVTSLGLWRIVEERDVAEAQRVVAMSHRQQAESLVNFIGTDLRAKLEPIGKVELLGDTARKTVQYYQARVDGGDTYVAPALADAKKWLGTVLLKGENYADAMPTLEEAARWFEAQVQAHPTAQPEARAAYRALAEVYLAQVDLLIDEDQFADGLLILARAAPILETLAAIDPDDVTVAGLRSKFFILLACAHGDMGRPQSAKAMGLHAIELLERADPAARAGDVEWHKLYAYALTMLGRMSIDAGDLAAAEGYFRRATAVVEANPMRTIDPVGWQLALAYSQFNLGDLLLNQGALPAALASLRASIASYQVMGVMDPARLDWATGVAKSYERIGMTLAANDPAAAIGAYLDSVAFAEKVLAKYPADIAALRAAMVARGSIGNLEERLDRDGLPSLRQAEALATQLVAKLPAAVIYQSDLALVQIDIGVALLNRNRLPEAEAALSQALEACERLAAIDTGDVIYRANLLGALHATAELYRQMGRQADVARLQQRIAQLEPR